MHLKINKIIESIDLWKSFMITYFMKHCRQKLLKHCRSLLLGRILETILLTKAIATLLSIAFKTFIVGYGNYCFQDQIHNETLPTKIILNIIYNIAHIIFHKKNGGY